MKIKKRKFRIGELAEELELKQSVIRFWEKEFNIKSDRSEGNQRFYDQKNFEKFKLIKELLYTKNFTLKGAKQELNNFDKLNSGRKDKQKTINYIQINQELEKNIKKLREQLIKLKDLL